jgi:outer membrane lipoprotein-sorting protein
MKKILLIGFFYVMCAFNPVFAQSENSTSDIKVMTQKFQNYIQNLRDVSGDFVQTASNGDKQEGKFYISIPGKMKIKYENGVLILADGRDFIYYDESNDQITVLDLKTSPAGVLLSATKLDYVGAEIVKVEKIGEVIYLHTQIKNASMNAMIIFTVEENPFQLTGWIVKDMQGVTTNFSMKNVVDVSGGFDDDTFILPRKKTFGSDGVKSGDDYY